MTGPLQHHRLEWNGILIEVRYDPCWGCLPDDIAHLEVETISPARAPLPFTETGYRSHFISPDAITAAGGPVAYVDVWLETASDTPAWREREQAARQFSLL